MKKLPPFATILIFLVAAAGLVGATFYFANRYLVSADTTTKPTIAACQSKGVNYMVTVQNNQAMPNYIKGNLCDTLTIKNISDQVVLMAFGPHENHIPYDGVTEKYLSKGQSFTVTLNQKGTFHFHDHLGDVAQGDFSVN